MYDMERFFTKNKIDLCQISWFSDKPAFLQMLHKNSFFSFLYP